MSVLPNLAFFAKNSNREMEDSKRDLNKSKRSRTDHVKNLVHSYLQKRNYASIGLQENSTIDQQITYSLVENEISRPNSILYSCYNSDPIVIDHNFSKFLSFVKDLAKIKNICHDTEYLIAPLFCHLYLDILKGGHSERAATFLKAHLPAIDKSKCDDFVKDLINLFANDCDATCMIEQYRSNKYFLELTQQSLTILKKFVVENCHVVFLHVLQTWFDLQQSDEKENESEVKMDEKATNGVCVDEKFQKILDAIHEVEKEPKQVFLLNISRTNEPPTCGLITRTCGLIAYNQDNIIHVRPIHPYDPILGVSDCKEITLTDHSKLIYSIVISVDHTRLVTTSEDSTLCIYDLEDIRLIKNCTGHLGPVYCAAISSNNSLVASGSHDTTGRIWNVDTGQISRVLVGHNQPVTSIDFHPNCLYLATGSSDRNVRLWSVDNGSPLRLFHGCKGVVYNVIFSPMGDVLATVSDDKKIRIWDILSSKINNEIKHKNDPITKLAWSRDGKQLCSGSTDGVIRIWDVNQDSDNNEAISMNINGKILGLEYSYETFACVTTSDKVL